MENKRCGYDNSACCANDSAAVGATATIEMDRVAAAAAAARCCGANNNSRPGDPTVVTAANACPPKCPAVRTSPWDPAKTRFAALLTVFIVVWLLSGLIVNSYWNPDDDRRVVPYKTIVILCCLSVGNHSDIMPPPSVHRVVFTRIIALVQTCIKHNNIMPMYTPRPADYRSINKFIYIYCRGLITRIFAVHTTTMLSIVLY